MNTSSGKHQQDPNGSGDDRIIDLAAQKTEDEWARAAQAFFERATATWFTWLSWLFATGAVAFLARKTGDAALKWIEEICYFLLWMYFTYFLASIRIQPLWSRLERTQRRGLRWLINGALLLIALTVVLSIRYLLNHLVARLRDAAA